MFSYPVTNLVDQDRGGGNDLPPPRRSALSKCFVKLTHGPFFCRSWIHGFLALVLLTNLVYFSISEYHVDTSYT